MLRLSIAKRLALEIYKIGDNITGISKIARYGQAVLNRRNRL